ncbi:hypothetical protein QOT17_016128 [Balamuthia mandrillaris]
MQGVGTLCTVHRVVSLGTCLWHTAAAYYFLFRGRGILRKYFVRAAGTPHPHTVETLRFLGAINLGYALLALISFLRSIYERELRATDHFVLGLANFSQFVMDLIAHRSGLAQRSLLQITIPDGIFAAANVWVALVLAYHSPRLSQIYHKSPLNE